MKKYLAIGLMGLCALTMSARPAVAVVGVILNSSPVFLVGLAGMIGVMGAYDHQEIPLGPPTAIALAGLLLLDSQGNPTADFAPMTEQSAIQLGVNAQELAAFNQELPEINAINESIASEANARFAGGESKVDVRSFVSATWAQNKLALSQDAVSAVDKIGAALAK